MAAVDLVVVGSVGIDSIETPLEKRSNLLGGSATYACAAASLFARAGMVGVVGNDFPAEFMESYRRFSINLDGLRQVAGPTFRWSGVYQQDFINRETISTELGVFAGFKPDLPECYRDAPFLLLGNISPELQLQVLDQIRRPRLIAADTMDLWIRTARPQLLDLVKRIDLLMLNDAEARLFTGRHNLCACAEALLELGPRHVVIKKGEHGAMLFSRRGTTILPAFPLPDPRDPTGAGDMFAGATMGVLAGRGQTGETDLRHAFAYGAVVAAFGVESFSLEGLTGLTRNKVENRLRELRGMIECGPV